ncbi:phage shock protein C (PspC) family protein [Haloactinopolyspora alba]|uniref:Phage shock protein C (PspC) family protein n=1 Tax=Haloactinopolyspora alba TaxID=648780 RepID=A0A2P8E1C1_9ACTN|nr:PspC domain-containing protein [Haloactinopolyspora alba]PSL03239.1 phage shock protein C (PspC) family protein [Haloactinopolyspora alba]
MTDLPPPSPTQQPPRVSEQFRSLRRSRSDRVVAGVLGGLGRRLGIDPVLLRITTVVLAIFSGIGVLLYSVAWLLIPAEDEDGSVLDHALGRREDRRSGSIPLALGLTLLGVVTASGIIAGSWDSGVLLLLAAAGLFALIRRRDDDDASAGAATPPPEQAGFGAAPATGQPDPSDVRPPGLATEPTTGWRLSGADAARPAAGSQSAPSTTGPVVPGHDAAAADTTHPDTTPAETADASTADASTADASAADANTAAPEHVTAAPANVGPSSGWPEGPDWGISRQPVPPPEPAPAPAPKTRSTLGPLTFCSAIVAVGVLAVQDVYWAAIPVAAYVALPLAVVSVGLLVGTWRGRSRGLIVLGVLLTIMLVPATWASQWDMNDLGSDEMVRFTRPEQIPDNVITRGAGTVNYDLSDLALADGESVTLQVQLGAGDMTVVVPRDADVDVTATLDAGDMVVFGNSQEGVQRSIDTINRGPDGPGGGTITLDLEVGLGDLEVTR